MFKFVKLCRKIKIESNKNNCESNKLILEVNDDTQSYLVLVVLFLIIIIPKTDV